MNHINKNTYFTTDSVSARSQSSDDESVTIDSVSETTDWATIPVETIDDARSAMFDRNRFHRFETVVARPIAQEYVVNDESYMFKKPSEELRKARSSLVNAPFTLDHPSGGRVTDSDEIHGFFDNVSYDNIDDSLTANLYVPENDQQAHERLSVADNVSIGFYHNLDRASAMDDIDGHQRDIVIDHAAVVENGRCSAEDGCQISTDCAGDCDCDGRHTAKYQSGIDTSVPLEHLHIDDVHPHYRGDFERACRDHAQSREDWKEFLTDKGIEVLSQTDSDRSQDPDDESVPTDGPDEKSTDRL